MYTLCVCTNHCCVSVLRDVQSCRAGFAVLIILKAFINAIQLEKHGSGRGSTVGSKGGGLGSAVGSQGGQSTPNRTTGSGVDSVRSGALNVSANDQVT